MHRRFTYPCISALFALVAAMPAAAQPSIYATIWGDAVVRIDLDTGVRTTLLEQEWIVSAAVDPVRMQLFIGFEDGFILRSELDGSNVDTLLTPDAFDNLHGGRGGSSCGHHDLWVDEPDQKLYATGSGWCGSHFIRMNLDGSELEWIGGTHTGGGSMAIHPDTRRVYLAVPWFERWIIARDLDTGNPETLIRADSTLGGALFDFTSGKMYWASGDSTAILKADLDGTGVELVTELTWTPHSTSLALDTQNEHLYYTSSSGAESLFRVNLDGTERTVVAAGGFRDMAVLTASSSPLEPRPAVVGGFELSQNYPNPFNPTTTISYDLPRLSEATLTVYDVLGRHVRTVASGTQSAGIYEVSLDADGLPSGIYFYRLEAADYVETKRMVIVK